MTETSLPELSMHILDAKTWSQTWFSIGIADMENLINFTIDKSPFS